MHPAVAEQLVELRRALEPTAQVHVVAEHGDGWLCVVVVPVDPQQPAMHLLLDPARLPTPGRPN